MNEQHDHEIHDRLRRIEGQVSGILRMHTGRRNCVDMLDQIAAARAGLDAVALLLLEDHVNTCARDALEREGRESKTAEMLSAVRRFVRSM